jgi:hypothetical protein
MWTLREMVDLKTADGIDQSDLITKHHKRHKSLRNKEFKQQKRNLVPNQKNKKEDKKKVKGLPCKNQSCQHSLGKVGFYCYPKVFTSNKSST